MSSPYERNNLVFCPLCNRPTDRLKVEDIPVVLFVVVYIAWNSERVVACSDCMRKRIHSRMVQSIFLANLLFPIMFVTLLMALWSSSGEGHSVPADELPLYHAPRPTVSTSPYQAKPTWGRLVLVLGILALVAIGIVILASTHR